MLKERMWLCRAEGSETALLSFRLHDEDIPHFSRVSTYSGRLFTRGALLQPYSASLPMRKVVMFRYARLQYEPFFIIIGPT